MVLGIGFAELADELDITGTVEISKTQADATFDGDVHFNTGLDYTYGASNTNVVKTGSEHHTSNPTAGGNVSFSADGDTVTFMSTTFADIGDVTSIKLTIVNEYHKAVKVTAVISYTNNGDSCFKTEITGDGIDDITLYTTTDPLTSSGRKKVFAQVFAAQKDSSGNITYHKRGDNYEGYATVNGYDGSSRGTGSFNTGTWNTSSNTLFYEWMGDSIKDKMNQLK